LAPCSIVTSQVILHITIYGEGIGKSKGEFTPALKSASGGSTAAMNAAALEFFPIYYLLSTAHYFISRARVVIFARFWGKGDIIDTMKAAAPSGKIVTTMVFLRKETRL
jgi:hypothetical protein